MTGMKGNPRRKPSMVAGLRSKFRWKVYPEHPWGPRRDHSKSTHVKKIKEVEGEYFTLAKPADYLENPQTITSKGPWIGIPIVNEGMPNAAKMRKGQRKPRAKPTWRKTSVILKKHKNRYNFRFPAKVGHTILWARDKKNKQPPFAVMLLVKRVHMSRNYLRFFDTFKSLQPEFLRRYDEEMQQALERIANASKRS